MTTRDLLWANIDEWARNKSIYSIVGTVVSIDETERSCEVEPVDGSANIEKVRLQASLSLTTGFVCVPSVGSFVIVTFINDTTGYISLFSEIDKILFDSDLVQFNGGGDGGLPKTSSLITKINQIENWINNFVADYNTHTHICAAPGVASATPLPVLTETITPTISSDLENLKIKQ